MPDILAILPQQLVFGLVLGTVYGLIAIGYTMVYGVLFMINFAHGEVFMIGAYIGWGVLSGLVATQVGGLHPAWVLPLMLAPAMIGCGALGVALERFAYRPLYLRGATRLGPLISAVGASIFLQNAVMLTQGARMKTYIGWGVLSGLVATQVGGLHPAWVLPLMLAPAMIGCGALGVALERFAYRPLYLRGATRLGPLISAVGASIFLQNAVMLTQGARMKTYKTFALFPRTWSFDVFGVRVSALALVMAAVAGAMMWGLNALVQRTTLGRSIRAVAEDREMAAIMGVDVSRVVATTFFLGSALGGAAGVLVGLYYTQIDFVMGFSAGLKAFTAAVLGGIGNIRGAMLGGVLLGVIESLAVTLIDPAFKDVVAFAVLILVLTFRPEGLLGEALPDWRKV